MFQKNQTNNSANGPVRLHKSKTTLSPKFSHGDMKTTSPPLSNDMEREQLQ